MTTMHADYSSVLTGYIRRWRPTLLSDDRFEVKSCFGAKAGYWASKIFVSCGAFGLALKLPSKTIDNLFRNREAVPLKYFERGHIKRGYAVVAPSVLANDSRMRYLFALSLRSVQ